MCKQNNKTKHICIFIIIMENVTETNDHKKRQRRKKKKRKQENIEEIITKFCANSCISDIVDKDNLVTVFQPVHNRYDGQNFESICLSQSFMVLLHSIH